MNLYRSQTKLRKKSKNRSRNMHEEEVKKKISKRKKQPEVKIKGLFNYEEKIIDLQSRLEKEQIALQPEAD